MIERCQHCGQILVVGVLKNGPLLVDQDKQEAWVENIKIPLTPKEYQFLLFFMENKGRLLKHRDIKRGVWGSAYIDQAEQYVRVVLSNIRKKLAFDERLKNLFVLRHGIGYEMLILGDEK